MSRISKRLASTGAVDMVATAAPGIKDILILGKVKQLEQRRAADLIVLDAPAAGHAITFLRSARGLLDAVRVGPDQHAGPRRARAADRPGPLPGGAGHAARGDAGQRAGRDGLQPRGRGRRQPGPGRRQRLLPRASTASTSTRRRRPQAAGASLRPGEAEALAQAAEFRRHRMALQAAQVERLAETLPLPQLALPYLFTADLGPAAGRPARRGAARRRSGGSHDRRRPRVTARRRGARRTLHRPGPRAGGHRLHRLGRRRQDHDGRGHGPRRRRGSGRKACVVTIDPAKRLADALGPRGADQHAQPHRRRRGPASCGRSCSTRRAPSTTSSPSYAGQPGAGRGDPRQPLLPEHLRRAVGHPGVHGDGEALRAARRDRLRPRRGRHAADPQRPRLPRGARSG